MRTPKLMRTRASLPNPPVDHGAALPNSPVHHAGCACQMPAHAWYKQPRHDRDPERPSRILQLIMARPSPILLFIMLPLLPRLSDARARLVQTTTSRPGSRASLPNPPVHHAPVHHAGSVTTPVRCPRTPGTNNHVTTGIGGLAP
jgi:hypothetical protein